MVGPKSFAVLALAMLVAGCSNDSAPGPGDGSSSLTNTAGAPLNGANATAPRLLDPWRVTMYLTEAGGLQRDIPAAGEVPFGFPLGGFASGFDPPAFAQPALGHAVLIGPEDVLVTLFISSQGPQVSNGNFDAAMWFGSSAQKGLGLIATGQQVVPAGESQMIEETLEFGDRAPLFIEGNDEITFEAGGSFGGETGEPRLLVGGDRPSFIEFTVRNYTVDPLAGAVALAPESFTGEVTNYSGPACTEFQGATLDHDVAVDAEAILVRLVLSKASSQLASADVDLLLLDGTRQIAASTSIRADEAILVAADILDGLQGKTLTARVHACGPGGVQYKLDVEQSRLPPS